MPGRAHAHVNAHLETWEPKNPETAFKNPHARTAVARDYVVRLATAESRARA